MRTVCKDVFLFSELSDNSKEKARSWYRQNLDYDWFDSVYDDAKSIAELFGLDIDKIYFSGFSSQGDGASFTGYYLYKKGALKEVKDYAPIDNELHRIVERLQKIQQVNFYHLRADITQQGRYVHSYTMRLNVWRNDGIEVNEDTENTLLDILRDYANWIYSNLHAEYDWIISDEQVDESITCNEYEFNDDGSIYHG